MRRLHVALLIVASVVACRSAVDQQKFDSVYRAGKALQVSVEQSSATDPALPTLLRRFQTEIAVLDGRAGNDRERAAIAKYRAAADAYEFLLALRAFDLEAVNGRMLLAGGNVDAAERYGLRLEEVQTNIVLGRTAWSPSGPALKTMFELAPRALGEADRIVNGQ
jgi:hypothetical protein